MKSENSKISDPHRLLNNHSDKINLKRNDKCVALSNFSIYYNRKIQKNLTKIINLKCELRHGMKILNYLIDHIFPKL